MNGPNLDPQYLALKGIAQRERILGGPLEYTLSDPEILEAIAGGLLYMEKLNLDLIPALAKLMSDGLVDVKVTISSGSAEYSDEDVDTLCRAFQRLDDRVAAA